MKTMSNIKMLILAIGINEIVIYTTIALLSFFYMPIMLAWVCFTILFRMMTLKHELVLMMQRSLKNGLSGVQGFEKYNDQYQDTTFFMNELNSSLKHRFNVTSGNENKKTIPTNSVLRLSHLNQYLTEQINKNSTVFKHSFNMTATLLTIVPTAILVSMFSASEFFSIVVSSAIILYFILLAVLKSQLDIRAIHLRNIAETSGWDNKYNSQLVGNVVCMSPKYK